jgi:hypothetical protein
MIKLKDILIERSDADLIAQIEQEIMFIKSSFRDAEDDEKDRQEPGYERELETLLPIAKKHGIAKAKEIYKTTQKYTARNYGRMNKSLRSGKSAGGSALIDQYIEAAPKFTGNRLYRGIGRELYERILAGKPKTLTDPAFMSVTSDPGTAQSFARRTGKGGVLVLTGDLSKAARAPLGMMHAWDSSEQEYIFPRNMRMEITRYADNQIEVKVI